MVTMKWFQHGDVIVQPTKIPAMAQRSTKRILVEGEVTGHAHRLTEDADVEVYEHEGTLFLRVGSRGAGLIHEEHGLGMITEGEYRVGRVMEYDHFAEEARRVVD